MKRLLLAAALAFAALAPTALTAQTAVAEWRTPDPENLLVIDTSKGRIVVEMAPQAAPGHIERIKLLTRKKFYDGLLFHRVINVFMAQTGDPQGTGLGGSDLPDIPAELIFQRTQALPLAQVSQEGGTVTGFVGPIPVLTRPDDVMVFLAQPQVAAAFAFCPGVAGMARSNELNTANSQFFLMRGVEHGLDGQYTGWGVVVQGMNVLKALNVGEPPANPDRMVTVRVAADMPANERPRVQVMDTRSPAFAEVVRKAREAKRGNSFDVCDVVLPTREG